MLVHCKLFLQVVEEGYQFFAGRRLVTLFSASNFREQCDNAAAFMAVDENLLCSFKVRMRGRSYELRNYQNLLLT